MSTLRYLTGLLRRRRIWAAFAGATVLGGLAAAGALTFAGAQGGPSPGVLVQEPPPASPSPMTLLEAWDEIAAHLAQWGDAWRIGSLASSDVYDDPDEGAGGDGRRVTWQAEVFDARTGEVRWLRLTGGELVDARVPGWTAPPELLVPLERPTLDSPEALELAKAAKPSLGPGRDKAAGYHFSYGAVHASQPAIAVLGEAGGFTARVLVDPRSGTVLAAERLAVHGGGLYVSRDGGVTWDRSPLDGLVQAVVADAGGGDAVYAVVWSGDDLALWRSVDAGGSWVRLAVLPSAAGPVAHAAAVGPLDGDEAVVVATNGGLWTYRIGTARLEQLPAPGLVVSLAVDGSGTWHAAAMEPGAPETLRVYRRSSANGAAWEPTANQGASDFATGPAPIPYDRGRGERLATLDAAGTTLLRATGAALEQSTDGGATWEAMLEGPFTDVVASPDGRSAVAVRYPGSLVASADGGTTWQDAAALPGAREVKLFAPRGGLYFAAIAGGFEWQPF
mgnify:CR=1 FL=1